MHETLMARDLKEAAERHGKVKGMTVEVGELAHIPARDLEGPLKELCPWPVQLKEVPALVKCRCGHEGRPKILEKGHDSTVWACAKCQRLMPKVLKGDKIMLTEAEI
ncbi:hydrogenase maturation nickel metallochaperone HypA [Candidatus Woesearchaeota archaeon]|nr:hydrogenase maturation nickel metallochaperone HypA [Candidatus Woesearchaeota archaeon]